MSDIYVFSSNDNTNDYSTMGLVGALTPTECAFKETANGESIVELTHPLDSFGRYTALQRGNILAVPVPVRTTPEIHNGQCVTTVWTYKVKPLNQLTSTAQRTLYMRRFSNSPKVAVLKAGEELTVVWKANEEEPVSGEEDIHPWKAKSKYGEGWIDPDALELVTTHSIEDDPAAIEEIQSPWTVTKQYFRIYETKKSISEISVTARHISYDLLYNMTSYRMGSEASFQDILDGVLEDCYAEHQFSAYTNLDGTQAGNWYDQRNPIDVFLNEDDGLCKRFGVDLIRDNYDLYFLKNPGINRGVRIQYGKNMTGIDFTTSDDEVATRIVPVGEKKDGTKLYLDDSVAFPGILQYGSRGNTVKELQSRLVKLGYSVGSTGIDGIFEWRTENGLNSFKADAGLPQNGIYDEETHKALMEALGVTSEPYIDSEHINDYPIIHVYELQCENCTVGTEEDGGGKVTEEIARARMRQQAEDLLEGGCDLPKIEMSVEFINLGDTEEYKQFRNLENCFLYDYVIVQHPTMDIDVTAQIMEIEWDCLLDRMVSVEIGSIGKTLANTGITSWQIPNGFSGSKIAGGSISGGALQSDIISVRHMQAESINTDALQAACVTAVKIAAGAIEANHISTETFEAITANIDWASIDWAEIENLSTIIAEIAKAQITTANIKEANIDWASIGNLAVVVADIAKAQITTANIEQANISWASIDNLTSAMADVVHAQIEVGDFSFADIKNLLSNAMIIEMGSAGNMSITNLTVTQANMLGAVIKNLVMPGSDGKYYEIVVGTNGELSTAEVVVTEEEISSGVMDDGRSISTTTINAELISGSTVTAQQAILNSILTNALTAEQITAGQALIASATIPTLYTTSIEAIGNSLTFSANQQIQLIVSEVNEIQNTANSAQQDAEFAKPYISATPPEEAPKAGKLWLDEGVTPSVLRKWRGAEVTTEREYEETIESDAPPINIDNAMGQLQTIAIEAGCRAKQDGSGDPSPDNVRAITGRESVDVRACGKNLVDLSSLYITVSNVQMDMSDDSVRVYTTDEGGEWRGTKTPDFTIFAGVTYTLSATLSSYVSGYARVGLRGADNNTFVSGASLLFNATTGKLSATYTPDADDEVYLSILCTSGTVLTGDCTFADIQLEISGAATDYEPYRSIGGGTVTPDKPLYGLPGAKDTVEVAVDGDVLVTRRTGILILDGTSIDVSSSTLQTPDGIYAYARANIPSDATAAQDFTALCSHYQVIPRMSASDLRVAGTMSTGVNSSGLPTIWLFSDIATATELNAFLAAQHAAGAPVTIVYELAVPQSEALSAVLPIAPAKGQVNLSTDADSLTATITGSGWETVNDTSGLAGDISSTQSGLEDLSDKLDAANDVIAQMASQIITPEGIVATVEASAGYQSIKTQAETAATGVSVINTKVIEVDGRLEKIEGSVRIQGSEITLGRSDSPYQNTINEEGSVITEDGQEILAIRGSKMESARVQISDAIIIGGIAIKTTSDGHVYFLRR